MLGGARDLQTHHITFTCDTRAQEYHGKSKSYLSLYTATSYVGWYVVLVVFIHIFPIICVCSVCVCIFSMYKKHGPVKKHARTILFSMYTQIRATTKNGIKNSHAKMS